MPPSPLIIVTLASSSVAMQSQRMLPPALRTRRARWPMPNAGVEPMPMMPFSYSRNVLVWLCRSACSVVQVWPRAGTYCRSSSQIAHCAGACALSANCVPQAVQMKNGIGLFRLQSRLLDHRTPFGQLGLEEFAAFLRRRADWYIGHCGELRLHVGLREGLADQVVKLADNVLGRAGGYDDRGPGGALDFGEAGLRHGRHVRQCRRSRLAGNGKRAQLAGLDQRHRGCHGAKRDRRVAANGGLDGGAAAVEWHVHQIELQRMLKQRADELWRRAGARRGVALLARIGADPIDQLLHRLRRHGWVDREHDRRGGSERHRVEILERVVA